MIYFLLSKYMQRFFINYQIIRKILQIKEHIKHWDRDAIFVPWWWFQASTLPGDLTKFKGKKTSP